jgi:hypothetical protein
MWESGAQWAAPQHDLPVALLTAIAALGGGRGAMGSNRATAALLQVNYTPSTLKPTSHQLQPSSHPN